MRGMMFPCPCQYCYKVAVVALLLARSKSGIAEAFAPSKAPHHTLSPFVLAAEGFSASAFTVKERPTRERVEDAGDVTSSSPLSPASVGTLSAVEAKRALIELLPRMTGKDEEYRAVESYVNLLEDAYTVIQTIDFLNLAMSGDWQLLFSTNLAGRVSTKLRLRELSQRIESDRFGGSVSNVARWEYAEDGGVNFDATGTFSSNCSYRINQGARMVVDLDGHEMRPARGSRIPRDIPFLVGLIRRAIPGEMFDPNGHAMDTTYLDADLRIVRLTGLNHEGVRNIFMRKGSLEISPM